MKLRRVFHILEKQIRNERGDALALAMLMLTISIIASLVMIEITRQVEVNSKRPRAKSMMAATEAKVREALLSPISYSGCGAAGRAACNPISSTFTSLSRPIKGTSCPATKPSCGIDVSIQSWTPSLVLPGPPAVTVSRAIVRIRYEGTEFSLKDINVQMDIPTDVLQQANIFMCPNTLAPKFIGFNADGTLNCAPLPPDAGIGQYIKDVNLANLTTTPVSLPTIVPASQCAASGKVVGHVDWGDGGNAFNFTCVNRSEPYTEFGFVPGADATYVTNTD